MTLLDTTDHLATIERGDPVLLAAVVDLIETACSNMEHRHANGDRRTMCGGSEGASARLKPTPSKSQSPGATAIVIYTPFYSPPQTAAAGTWSFRSEISRSCAFLIRAVRPPLTSPGAGQSNPIEQRRRHCQVDEQRA